MQPEFNARRAHAILAFFTLLNVINMVDRNLIVGFTKQIMEDLSLTNTQFGLLTGLVFTALYTVVGVFCGLLADRWNRPRLIGAGLFLWSLMTAASGLARSFAHMAGARLFIGVGEAALTPTALSLLSDTYPPHRRAFAAGIYYLGVPVGVGVGLIFAAFVGPMIGWRNSFFLMGVIGVLLTGAVLLIADPPRGGLEAGGASKAHESFGAVIGEFASCLMRSPALMFTMLGSVLTHVILGATYFDQKWLIDGRGFSVTEAPMLVGVLFLIGGSLGTVAGGALGDYFHTRIRGGRLTFLAIALVMLFPIGLLCRFVEPRSAVFYASILVNCFALTFFYGPVFSAVQDLAPVRVRSTALAVLLLASNLIGISGGAFAAGALADRFSKTDMADPITWAILYPVFTGMGSAVFYLLAGLTYASSRRRLIEGPQGS